MSVTTSRKCPDCHQEMEPIQLIDKLGIAPFMASPLQYVPADTDLGTCAPWSGKSGRIRSYLCGKCGRILLYGEPTA